MVLYHGLPDGFKANTKPSLSFQYPLPKKGVGIAFSWKKK